MEILTFSERERIEKQFLAWCEEHNAQKRPTALIAYMLTNDWLNVAKVKEDLRGEMNE